MEFLTNHSLKEPSTCPFQDGKYTGNIHIKILKDEETSACFIQVKGQRVTLETFQGPYYQNLKNLFKEIVQERPHEFEDMKEIFGNALTRQNYGSQKPQTDEEIEKRIAFSAKRAFLGNLFTGFAAIDNTTQKIIGFVSIGCGYQKGESQSALLVHNEYKKKGYSKEVTLLAAALANVYFHNSFEVGPKSNKGPVDKFTASVLNSNLETIEFLKKIGMTYIRPLIRSETYSDEPRSLYGIDAKDVEKKLEKFIDLKNITWEVLKSSI